MTKLAFLTLALCSPTEAFVSPSQALATPRNNKIKLAAESPRLTEVSLREYLGSQGLRYNLNKTDKEIESEGDYSILDKVFGPTSNNAARLALKKEVRVKASTPSPSQIQVATEWLTKYGYSRFFPAYMDKSQESADEVKATEKAAKKALLGALGYKPEEPKMLTKGAAPVKSTPVKAATPTQPVSTQSPSPKPAASKPKNPNRPRLPL
jgi:hypothetical protein